MKVVFNMNLKTLTKFLKEYEKYSPDYNYIEDHSNTYENASCSNFINTHLGDEMIQYKELSKGSLHKSIFEEFLLEKCLLQFIITYANGNLYEFFAIPLDSRIVVISYLENVVPVTYDALSIPEFHNKFKYLLEGFTIHLLKYSKGIVVPEKIQIYKRALKKVPLPLENLQKYEVDLTNVHKAYLYNNVDKSMEYVIHVNNSFYKKTRILLKEYLDSSGWTLLDIIYGMIMNKVFMNKLSETPEYYLEICHKKIKRRVSLELLSKIFVKGKMYNSAKWVL